MAKNIFPIVIAAGAAFFLLGKKGDGDGTGDGPGEGGEGGVGGPGGLAGISSDCEPAKPLVVTVKLYTKEGVSHTHNPYGDSTTPPTPQALSGLAGDEVEWTTSKDAAGVGGQYQGGAQNVPPTIITIPLHDHRIELTSKQIQDLLAGKVVKTETSYGSGMEGGVGKIFTHKHEVELRCTFKGTPAGTGRSLALG